VISQWQVVFPDQVEKILFGISWETVKTACAGEKQLSCKQVIAGI